MKDEPHSPFRRPEKLAPTVIHHPEEHETILARWLREAIERGPRFWLLLGGIAVGVVVGVVLANVYWFGESKSSEAWSELLAAKTAKDQEEVAHDHPNSVVGRWALLQAAGSLYNDAFFLLPTNRDGASPLLKRAYNLYAEAFEQAAQTDPMVARLAAMGMARTLETSNDLDRAIEQYRFVARTYPGTPEAEQAERRAEALEKPQNREFYKWLAAYKAPELTLDPLSKKSLELPPGHPPIEPSALPPPPPSKPSTPTPPVGDQIPAGPDAFEHNPRPKAEPPQAGAGDEAKPPADAPKS
jgi:hypothetical protein